MPGHGCDQAPLETQLAPQDAPHPPSELARTLTGTLDVITTKSRSKGSPEVVVKGDGTCVAAGVTAVLQIGSVKLVELRWCCLAGPCPQDRSRATALVDRFSASPLAIRTGMALA